MKRPFTVLVASDGSSAARAAVSLTLRFPWPEDTRVVGLVADAPPSVIGAGAFLRGILAQTYEDEARRVHKALKRRFADAQMMFVHAQPVDAILGERRKRSADLIVVGSRGLGVFGRVPLGSVSRRIVREAPCAVLVTKGRAREIHRFLIAVDGSPASMQAVRLVGRLKPSAGSRVLIVGVAAPVPVPWMGRARASVRADVKRDVAAAERKRVSAAQRHVDRAARQLRRAGWNAKTQVRRGIPLSELLRASREWRPDVLVFGARSTRGLNRVLLGSVADGLVSDSPISMLIAK